MQEHNEIFIAKTIETLPKRISWHKYYILKRPSDNKLAEHFDKEHDFAKELGFSSLEKGKGTPEERFLKEDLFFYLLNWFFLSFSNNENYNIKNICVCSKSKIKTEVASKQNLEHFKMINRRLFIHKFCSNSKMLLSSSWTIIIRALVFSSSPRANFSSFEYLCFSFLLIFRFILI